jgi:hypothetical protein
MAAADALAAPQTEFYAEAGARAAVRAGVLSRCDCALMLHLAARALCAHASRARTGGRHCGGRVCAASCRRRGLPGPGIAGAAPSRLRRRAAALPARPRRCAAAARRAPHSQARACCCSVACFGAAADARALRPRSQPTALHATLRLRTSPELRAPRAYGHVVTDASFDAIYHMSTCGCVLLVSQNRLQRAPDAAAWRIRPHDCVAFDFEFASSEGFSAPSAVDQPPAVQLAFEYTIILPARPACRIIACAGPDACSPAAGGGDGRRRRHGWRRVVCA